MIATCSVTTTVQSHYYIDLIHAYNTLFLFMQHKGNSYKAEMLHYLLFYPMNQMKDLPHRLDKFRLGGRRPDVNIA
jgi:hypothetical protein